MPANKSPEEGHAIAVCEDILLNKGPFWNVGLRLKFKSSSHSQNIQNVERKQEGKSAVKNWLTTNLMKENGNL